jgi:hemerythrin
MKYSSELIAWSRTFSCGIKIIDDQHKEFVDLVNDMFHHATGDEKHEHEYFNLVIQRAVKYIKIHFATEEKIMRALKYPGFAEHKRAHDLFVLKVVNKIQDFESEKHYTLYSFTKFLKDWVLSHIAVMDKEYFLYIKQIAAHKAYEKMGVASANVA